MVRRSGESLNEDVEEINPRTEDDILVVHQLVKRYPTRLPNQDGDQRVDAVRGISFGVKRGEIFALLGVNGAGKSSTFDCLVGVNRVSGGSVLIEHKNVDEFVGQPEKLHGLIGYCPQKDSFDD